MDLAKRFEEATTTASVNISSLILNRPYPMVHAKRINTKYGPTVLLSIRDVAENIVYIFLPKPYANVVTDEDLENINSRSVYLNLVLLVGDRLVKPSQQQQCIPSYFLLQIHTHTHETSRHIVRWVRQSVSD